MFTHLVVCPLFAGRINIHKAEHLGERRLIAQWWADYLDANREKGIAPFDYAKINRGNVE